MAEQRREPHRKVPTVACPTCKGDSVYAQSNAFRPFCSERCKYMDLGAWASEGFRIAANPDPEETPGPPPPCNSAGRSTGSLTLGPSDAAQ